MAEDTTNAGAGSTPPAEARVEQEAAQIIRELMEQWPKDHLPSRDLSVRAASYLNASHPGTPDTSKAHRDTLRHYLQLNGIIPAVPVSGIAKALQDADWSGVSIGNKALINAAIAALSPAPPVEEYVRAAANRLQLWARGIRTTAEYPGGFIGLRRDIKLALTAPKIPAPSADEIIEQCAKAAETYANPSFCPTTAQAIATEIRMIRRGSDGYHTRGCTADALIERCAKVVEDLPGAKFEGPLALRKRLATEIRKLKGQ